MPVSAIITDGGRRRHWSTPKKLRIVEETLDGRESISVVARRNGVVPNLPYRWRRLMLEGGSVAVAGDDDVIRSNLRWCSDGFEFTCWNGEVVRGAFIIDAHDREIIA